MEISKIVASMPARQRNAAKYLTGFFALMILLTFLSRAADSFTVPFVSTVKAGSGSLEHKVVADGSLHPIAQTAVFAPAGYRILALHAVQGGRVSAGDILAELDASLIREQLVDARAELQKLRLDAAANSVRVPGNTDESGFAIAEKTLERVRGDLEVTEREAQLRVEGAQIDVAAARRHLRELRDMDDEATDSEIRGAIDDIRRKEKALEEAELTRGKALEAARRAIEDAEILLEQEKNTIAKANENAAADERRDALTREVAYIDIAASQRKVEALEALLETEGVITAASSGVVIRVNGDVGSVTGGEALFVISDPSAGVLFRTSVSKDELKHIRRGDSVSIALTGEKNAVQATIENIETVADESGRYPVSAILSGENLEPGTGGKMTAVQKTAPYHMCVINGAIRKDLTGHFVLVVREKNGVLGVQTVAERVDISVLEQDNSRSAIEGALNRDDLIIVGGGRPVSTGDRVRLG